jgi:hypothetical protein
VHEDPVTKSKRVTNINGTVVGEAKGTKQKAEGRKRKAESRGAKH